MSDYMPTTEVVRICYMGDWFKYFAGPNRKMREIAEDRRSQFNRWFVGEQTKTLEAIVKVLNEKYGEYGPFIITEAELAAARGEGTVNVDSRGVWCKTHGGWGGTNGGEDCCHPAPLGFSESAARGEDSGHDNA